MTFSDRFCEVFPELGEKFCCMSVFLPRTLVLAGWVLSLLDEILCHCCERARNWSVELIGK